MTEVSIHEAINRAADLIDRRPEQYEFMCNSVPLSDAPHMIGCLLGWIGFYSGKYTEEFMIDKDYGIGVEHVAGQYLRSISPLESLCNALLFGDSFMRGIMEAADASHTFYRRMTMFSGDHNWRTEAHVAAKALRKYADHFHPKTPGEIPPTVQAIFETPKDAVETA